MIGTSNALRALLACLVLVVAQTLQAATFAEFLALAGDEYEKLSGSDFLHGVVWDDQPKHVYYQCTDRADRVSLELWQQEGAWVSTRGAPPQRLKFGQHGSVRVFSVFNEKNEPYVAAYFMLSSGETHVFRVLDWEVRLSSIVWQCSEAPWQAPAVQ